MGGDCRHLSAAAARLGGRIPDAADALADMEASGVGYDWDDVKPYLQARASDPTTARPAPKPIR